MEIFDDFVDLNKQDRMEKTMTSNLFDWFYNQRTSHLPMDSSIDSMIDDNTVDAPQFTHLFAKMEYKNPKTYGMVEPLVELLEQKTGRKFFDRLFRIKANFIYKNSGYPQGCYHTPHRDLTPEPTETLLYYVNNSDGDTVIFDDIVPVKTMKIVNRVAPKKGRGLLFDSSFFHASTSPRLNEYRIVINFVFYK